MGPSERPEASPPRRHSAKFLVAAAVGVMVVLAIITVSTTRQSREIPLETTGTALASTCTGTTTGRCLFFCSAWTNAECRDGWCQCREGSCNVAGSGVCAQKVLEGTSAALPTSSSNVSDHGNHSRVAKGFATSGGGMRAFAAALGSFRALHDVGMLDEFSAVSANSGGNWALSQFAYNAKIFEDVTSAKQTPGDIFQALWKKWQSTSEYQSSEAFKALVNWKTFTDTLMNTVSPNIVACPADLGSRAGFKTADLVSLMSIPAIAWVDLNPYTQDMAQSATIVGIPPDFTLPLAWISAGNATMSKSEWVVPGKFRKWVGDPNLRSSTRAIHVRSEGIVEPLDLVQHPNVGTIAAASSAALGGMFASPVDQAAILAQMGKSGFAPVFSGIDGSRFAICSDGKEMCTFPATRLQDGGYVDNLALPILVAHLQQKHGRDTELEIVAQVANSCDNTRECKELAYSHKDFSDSFDNYFDTMAGNDNKEYIYPPYYTRAPHRKTFAGKPPPVQKAPGDNDFWFISGKFTTVKNTEWGVKAGTTVKLLMFASMAQNLGNVVNGKSQGGTLPIPPTDHAGETLSNYASSVHVSLTKTLKAWRDARY